MFDRVISSSDEEAGRRSAVSAAFTSAICGAAIGGFLLGGLLFAVADPEPVEVVSVMVFKDPSGGAPDSPLPEAPKKPVSEPVADAEPDPDAAPTTATPPVETAPPGGGGTTEGPGKSIGPPGTGTDPQGTGGDDDEHRQVISHPELEVRRRVDPHYPDDARALGLGEQRCLATVFIDENGVPYDVRVASCPEVFHEAARKALLQWRWYPPKDGRNRVKAQTAVGVTYRLDR